MTRISTHLREALIELGYEQQGQHRWTHPTAGTIALAATPSDWRTERNTFADLRRRHPGHPALERNTRSQPVDVRRRRRGRGRTSRTPLADPIAIEIPAAPVRAPAHTQCGDCTRRWLSDLDPRTHNCPRCGGTLIVGRDWEPA